MGANPYLSSETSVREQSTGWKHWNFRAMIRSDKQVTNAVDPWRWSSLKKELIRILLVDDDEDDYVVLREMLSHIKDWRVRVQWVSSYDQALKTIESDLYDLCLMDYRLDQGTGLELMHELRKSGFNSPLIILTGQGDHEIDLRAMQDGAADYLEKGQINPQLLERSIRYTIERAKHLENLRRSEKQLHVLSSKLMEAQENERKRLAHELHDSIGASLTAVKFGLERELNRVRYGNAASDTTLLEQLTSTVETTIKDLKRIYGNLRPLILDDLGALPAIRSLIRQFSEVRPQVQFDQTLTLEETEIPEPLKIVIYRVCQEALNNISKHSDATVVELSLGKSKKAVVLLILDNGRGFDLREILSGEKNETQLGLESMKERVEMSGGSFTIVSNKTEGTMIKAVWPLSRQREGTTNK
jgi:signal transduction histidine kinase